MGLSGIDNETGVNFKTRKKSSRVKKDTNEDKSGLVIEKPVTKPIVKNTIVDDLKAMHVAEVSSEFKAMINSEITSYDFATDTDVNDTTLKAIYLGQGVLVEVTIKDGISKQDVYSTKLLHFWKKVAEVGNGIVSDFEGDEVNTFPIDVISDRNPELNMVKEDMVDQDDLTNEVKQKEEDLTMNTNTEYKKANELLASLKESGDAGVDILIDYCKVSFAEVFTKTEAGVDANVVGTDLQVQMVYIITEINKNDLLTPESKAKLVKAIEAESVEYQKLLESLTDVTSETKVLLEKKESDDMNWGTIALYTLGAVLAIGAAYSAYRYFEPGDVVLDMSTMSIMDR